MKKIAQTLTFLFVIALLSSACSTLPEDPRTWNTPGSQTKKDGHFQLPPKKLPVEAGGEIPHPVRHEQDNQANNPDLI